EQKVDLVDRLLFDLRLEARLRRRALAHDWTRETPGREDATGDPCCDDDLHELLDHDLLLEHARAEAARVSEENPLLVKHRPSHGRVPEFRGKHKGHAWTLPW